MLRFLGVAPRSQESSINSNIRRLYLALESSLRENVVLMKGIVKRFPGVLANDHVDFELRKGEVHGLLGENGAGKTTLMKVLYGIHSPEEGEIILRGKRVEIKSPKDAIRNRIGMVPQHFMLVDSFSVTENIVLGTQLPFRLDFQRLERSIEELGAKYGFKVDPRAKIWQLSAGEQQRAEILKALYRQADVLILDEPTSVLTPQETEELFRILREMAAEGKSITFISHKLDEVTRLCDRITVLRNGRKVATVQAAKTSKDELARLMVGRDVLFRLERTERTPGEVVLEVRDLEALHDKGYPALKKVSFELRRGEILGVAGVSGNGQRELVETLTGLRKASGGGIIVRGVDATNRSPHFLIKLGLGHIPEDRIRMGLVPNLNVSENLVLKKYRESPFSNHLLLRWTLVHKHSRDLVKKFKIVTPSERVPTKMLSGGNLQRVILARELDSQPDLMIAVYPTRGLDVAATEFVRKSMLDMRLAGIGVLLVSEDLDEILGLSDRIMVMYEGTVVGVVAAQEAQRERIGLMMAGVAAA